MAPGMRDLPSAVINRIQKKMNPSKSIRSSWALWPVALSVMLLALALPLTSQAQATDSTTLAAGGNGNGNNGNGNGNGGGVAPVPEPATWAAMISLVAVGALFARRHFKQSGGAVS